MTPEELRTRLLAEVEAKLKEVMSGEAAPQTLSEREGIALKVVQAVKERIMQEYHLQSSEAMIYATMIRLMVRRLAKSSAQP